MLYPVICVFCPLTSFIYFLECQILNVSFLAESSGDQRGNKMGLKQVAGKAHTGWHGRGKLFFFLQGIAYQSSCQLNEHRRKHILSRAWKANVVWECKVYYQDNQLEWRKRPPASFLLPPVYLAQLTPFFILQSSPQVATWS